MVSEEALKFISEVFIGDTGECYSYKSGPVLVEFFNKHYGYEDIYQSGFPSRWWYVVDKFEDLLERGQFDSFLSLILNKRYIMRDNKTNEINAVELLQKSLNLFNEQLQFDAYQIISMNGKYVLVNEDEDLEKIGEGGFAVVYLRKSDNKVLKKLRDEYITNSNVRSRFKREYEITNSLQDIQGVIKLYNFDENRMLYEMEKGDYTLAKYVNKSRLKSDEKVNFSLQLMTIMADIHRRNVIHRDLSPSNILFINGELKITDFGLGKNVDVIHSHQTLHTNAYGQYYYCAPEQLDSLKDGDKKSDVYSLGKVINFVLTGSPNNERHEFGQIINMATSRNPEDRYKSAEEMLSALEKMNELNLKDNLKEDAKNDIRKGKLTSIVQQYIHTLDHEAICTELVVNSYFEKVLVDYMKLNENNEMYVINAVENNFEETCPTFESHDPIASFAYSVIQDQFTYVTKEKAAKILHHIAYSVNRFSSQRMIERLVEKGVEPLIESVLQR
ncbi:serine/threonine-protein kinase [Oceanobacillus oncorhynchi]|uniref:serine/threonine-protein kinase n=1 Tax=Oceanobacillus oncorhynchi TaxID=545501 RepID=UPI00186884F7|nr:serine/threonine-protein kinase [Oceanobacillus oncorhynchi]